VIVGFDKFNLENWVEGREIGISKKKKQDLLRIAQINLKQKCICTYYQIWQEVVKNS
jgi:hypothetical protein